MGRTAIMSSALAEEEGCILLSSENDIRTCNELKARLMDRLRERCALSLDAGAFESGDITFVQILISAARTAEQVGGTVDIVNASPAFTALLERCGFDAGTLRHRSRQQ